MSRKNMQLELHTAISYHIHMSMPMAITAPAQVPHTAMNAVTNTVIMIMIMAEAVSSKCTALF